MFSVTFDSGDRFKVGRKQWILFSWWFRFCQHWQLSKLRVKTMQLMQSYWVYVLLPNLIAFSFLQNESLHGSIYWAFKFKLSFIKTCKILKNWFNLKRVMISMRKTYKSYKKRTHCYWNKFLSERFLKSILFVVVLCFD